MLMVTCVNYTRFTSKIFLYSTVQNKKIDNNLFWRKYLIFFLFFSQQPTKKSLKENIIMSLAE